MKFSLIALAAASAACAATVPYPTDPKAVDLEILQYALALEHMEVAFYVEALTKFSAADFEKAGYSPKVRRRLTEFAFQERRHVALISAAIEAEGVTPTAPCVYDFDYEDTPSSFLQFAADLEDVGASAYIYKSRFVNDGLLREIGASIASVESRHQALLAEYKDLDGSPFSFDTSLTGSEVVTLIKPLIKSCPASNPALPFKVFNELKVSNVYPAVGESIRFTFPENPEISGDLDAYAHFIWGISVHTVKLVKNEAAVPPRMFGKMYVVVSSTADRPNDDTTIAGPVGIMVGNLTDVASYDPLAPGKRAINFTA